MRAGLVLVLVWAAPAFAQEPRWTVDVTPASYVEAWELNDSVEHFSGIQTGVDRRVWRGVAIRAEATLLFVRQDGGDTWMRGTMLAMRARRRARRVRLFLDVGGGMATAATRVPPTGTRFNYLLLLGGGVEAPFDSGGSRVAQGRPWSRFHATLGARWLHLSNGGREGRLANPDVQSLGGFAGVGYRF